MKTATSWLPWLTVIPLILVTVSSGGWYGYKQYQAVNQQSSAYQQQTSQLSETLNQLTAKNQQLETNLASVSAKFLALSAVDQKLRNDELEATISAIEKTYDSVVDTYENLVKLREQTSKTSAFDDLFTKILVFLTKRNYASASAQLAKLQSDIKAEQDKLTAAPAPAIPANVPASNQAPGSGYSRQKVTTEVGDFLVSLVAADLSSTRVIVDTASTSDCRNDCPVLSLGDYVSRNGAYAGINGSYFCPASYPSCAGKTNSFDTLLMNKNKTYFNSDNNVYSTVPAVIFHSGSIRFVGASQEWGRDTSIDSMVANQPLLLSGGNITFGGGSDPKQGSRGNRSFVANRGNIVYIGVVHGATVVEVAHVLKALGMEGALNLDSGGSTALWSGGYKLGPGRNIPNAILFVKK